MELDFYHKKLNVRAAERLEFAILGNDEISGKSQNWAGTAHCPVNLLSSLSSKYKHSAKTQENRKKNELLSFPRNSYFAWVCKLV